MEDIISILWELLKAVGALLLPEKAKGWISEQSIPVQRLLGGLILAAEIAVLILLCVGAKKLFARIF